MHKIGLLKKKNKHLLEMTRSLIVYHESTKRLPTGDAILVVVNLINRMPLKTSFFRVLRDVLKCEEKYIVPLKLFGCVFVHPYTEMV